MKINHLRPPKPIEYEGVTYPSQCSLAKHLGVSQSVISYHLLTHGNLDRMRKSLGRECGTLVSYRNGCRCAKCRAANAQREADRRAGKVVRVRWCYVDGVRYASQKEAAKALGTTPLAISRRQARRRKELARIKETVKPLTLATLFHDHRRELAADYGFDVRDFDPESPAGKLMVATCAAVIATLQQDGLDL